ncbi:VelB [Drechmeria coniospora]|uniref:VelB n=1 Tax=Drechmeria coniospora TaxID=98403 RepID=A0A151GFR7_DRECN|nr:VelB [Drechmeria coniospora]KYK55939.1 VelB [Drechmeria coniospora]
MSPTFSPLPEQQQLHRTDSAFPPSMMPSSSPIYSCRQPSPPLQHHSQQRQHHQHHQQPPPPIAQPGQANLPQKENTPPYPPQRAQVPPQLPPHASSLQHHSVAQAHQTQLANQVMMTSQLQHPAVPDHRPANKDDASPSSGQMAAQGVLASFSKVDEATGRKYQFVYPSSFTMGAYSHDAATGREVDCNSIDHSMFVLNVDLWNDDGTREVNLVRSSTGSPSISSTTPYSYSSLNGGETSAAAFPQHALPANYDPACSPTHPLGYVQDYQMQPGFSHAQPLYTHSSTYGPPQQYFPQHQTFGQDGAVIPVPSQANMTQFHRNGIPVAPNYLQEQDSLARMAVVGGQPQGMFTRNLIGSLAASAFRLSDTSDHIGVWFVLQDLSVRTEGTFRLRFSFVNVGARGGARREGNTTKINTGRAPILASCFSDTFNVYSAKKFPGVCESTPLSKTFATQGIKIPIRKDANAKGGDDDDYGE